MTSLDNNLLAVGTLNNVDSIKIYNLTNGVLKYIFNNSNESFYHNARKFVEFDNNLLASMVIDYDSSFDYYTSFQVWNLTSGTLKYTLNHSSYGYDLAVFEKTFLITASSDSVKIWNVSDGSFFMDLVNSSIDDQCYVLASLENDLLAGGFSNGSIIIWNVTTGNVIYHLISNSSHVNTSNYDTVFKIIVLDNSSIASITYYGKINVWNMTSGILKYSFDNGINYPQCFDYLGDNLLGYCTTSEIKIWDLVTGRLLVTLNDNYDGWINSIVLMNASLLIGGHSDSSIRLWNITTWTLEYTLTYDNDGHYGSVEKLILLGNDSFASISSDQTVKIWKLNGSYCFN